MTTYQYSGSGFISESSTLDANRSFNYSISSISENNIEDYQSITNSVTSVDTYGEVTESTGSVTDYSLITETAVDTITPFGGLTFSGSAITQPNYRLFFSGASVEKVIYSPDNLGGTLFSFGEKVERRTYNYNESSSENTEEDYGLISSSILTSDDYGDLGSPGIIQDYGLTTEFTGGIITPFGGLTFSGSAITQSNYRLFFSGASVEKVIYSPDNTSGTLFGFGEKLESVTYDYNDESIVSNTDDYGLVTEITAGGGDFGLISESSGSQPEENYGLISETITEVTSVPFGSITLNGGSEVKLQRGAWIGSGQISISGSLDLKFITQSGESTQLFQLSGGNVYSEINSYVSTGTLFGFGEKLESRTYAYNILSSTDYASEDFGILNEIHSSESDLGLITLPIDDGIDNYGRIGPNITSIFGSITLSGASTEKFDKGLYSGSGSFTLSSGYSDLKFTSGAGESTQLFQLSGGNIYSEINSYVSTGTLFGFGEKLESVTYDYNNESIVSNTDDYGLITSTSFEGLFDYGLIDDNSGAIPPENFGLISETILSETSTPFGTITLSGDAVEVVERDFTYNASGTIDLSGTIIEKFTSGAGESTQLFQLSGGDVYSEINSYVTSGTLFGFGEKLESVTYDYNETAIVPQEDFGNIVDAFTEFDDWGDLSPTSIAQNYGTLETIGGVPFGSIFISGAASDLRETDAYSGSGTIFISGATLDVEIDSYNASGSITLSGTALESESEVYIGIGTIFMDAVGVVTSSVIARTISYVGLGTLTLSGTALESYSAQTPEDTQLFTISGVATERVLYDTPDNTELFVISGLSSNREIQVYGLDYVTSGTLTLSGSLVEKNTESYVGLGTASLSGLVDDSKQRVARGSGSIFINGLGVESRTIFIPTPGIGTGFIGGNINISSGIALTNYYSPIYPRNAGIPGSGIGTIRVNDDNNLTITRAVLPYFGRGGFVVSNTGNESFSRTNYDGSGLITLSGVSSNREIAVYTAVGLGTITLSDSFRIRDVKSYSTSGIIYLGKYEVTTQSLGDSSLTFDNDIVGFDDSSSQFVYSEAITTETDAYRGTGTIRGLSGVSDSVIIQPTTNTQLFTIVGSAAEAYSAQTPETEVLYQFSGNITERRTYGYEGSGQATFGSSALQRYEPRNIGVGLLRFATYLSDNLYDTCDSDNITSDHQISAFVSFVSNPPENTVLYNFYGSASTEQTQLYTYSGSGSVGISGSHVIRTTKSVVGIGTLNVASTAVKKDVNSYIGSGSIGIVSGSSESTVSIIPQSTVLFSISGVSSNRTFNVYTYSGIGTGYFSGFATSRVSSTYSYSGVGTVYLSGELVHPNVQFIPVAKGIGGINFSGSGTEKVGYEYLPTSQNLFVFSGGFESFIESGYVGFGTVYIESISASIANNPYQPPRVYVTII